MHIDIELFNDAVDQGFQLQFVVEGESHFWDRDEFKQVFWFVLPDGQRSKNYRSFEEFQEHLRMKVKKKREGIGFLTVLP